ncbi:MAG: cobalamin-dependent protein [Coriobacteriia bacterium]|nr:cobalamin-dependent protein [Coriobacteriia bacterium]
MQDGDVEQLFRAFTDNDPAAAIRVVEQVRASGVAQADLFDELYVPAIALLGEAWARRTIDEFAFTQAAVVAEQVSSFVMPPLVRADTGVGVVLGVMHRDRHTVMKNVVAGALKESGYRVFDLGSDVRASDFLERIEETGARIAIVFAEMLATARAVESVSDLLSAEGRSDVVLLVCGGPFAADPALARSVGAKGVISSAQGALEVLERVRRDLLDKEAG